MGATRRRFQDGDDRPAFGDMKGKARREASHHGFQVVSLLGLAGLGAVTGQVVPSPLVYIPASG